MSKCKPNYKNLQEIKSFSEQREVTVQLVEQACMNDEWLRHEVKSLDYRVSPSYRKRFSPILLDSLQSWGCVTTTDGEVIFNNSTSDEIHIDFDEHMNLVDEMQSTCDFETHTEGTDDDKTVTHRAILTTKELTEEFTGEKCLNENKHVNSFWYVGYDKTKPYEVRPDWLKQWRDLEIPSVARAQTFKCNKTGFVSSVSIKLENTGVTNSNWGSPLYVQIQDTVKKVVDKTKWDAKKKKSVPVYKNGQKVTETVYYPKGNPHNPLALGTYNPSHTTPGFISILFDKPVKLLKDHHYAICFYSPLSHPDHCPRIGGWGRNCFADKYEYGDAFLSERNGRNWIRYGKNDLDVKYQMGKYTPLDFCFQLNMFNKDEEYNGSGEEEAEYLYLKPIFSNPITSVKLSAQDTGDVSGGNVHIQYQVSQNGKIWTDIDKTTTKEFVNPTPMLFVRAKMWRDTSSPTVTPVIEKITLNLTMNLPNEFYARTEFYHPNTTPMLGASHWGRIYAPFECDKDTDCTVEIIQDKLSKDNFNIITAEELPELTSELDVDHTLISSDNLNERYQYLIDNPDVVDLLNTHNIYVKPYTDDQGVVHPFGWWTVNESGEREGGFKLTQCPAYPMLECTFEPTSGDTFYLGEWHDYIVDYTNDTVLFDEGLINEFPIGAMTFTYNPVFIQDLILSEVGDWIDSETGLLEQGLILDYFKETITVTSEHVLNKIVPLRVSPIDPIKELIVIPDEGDETELFEDVDFSINYVDKEIIFPIVNMDNASPIIKEGDVIQIVYTPNIPEKGLAIGYRGKRTNLNNQVRIKANYIEYKV